MAEREQDQRISVEEVVRRVAEACKNQQPRRYTERIDIDKIVVTAVNSPFPTMIDAPTLAAALKSGDVPEHYAGHVARLLEEVPLVDILRFYDRHGISATEIARVVRQQTGLRRPDLEEYLDELVPIRLRHTPTTF